MKNTNSSKIKKKAPKLPAIYQGLNPNNIVKKNRKRIPSSEAIVSFMTKKN